MGTWSAHGFTGHCMAVQLDGTVLLQLFKSSPRSVDFLPIVRVRIFQMVDLDLPLQIK